MNLGGQISSKKTDHSRSHFEYGGNGLLDKHPETGHDNRSNKGFLSAK